MDWKIFVGTFCTLFLAELGDKTQLACIMMAATTKKPWTVFLGASLALVLVSLIGVLFAQFLFQYLPPGLVKKTAALGFIAIGVLLLFDLL